ncbi:5'-nucleotidase C-terminal domain-containing protein [Nonomuraea sp. NPDC050328]|uniref:5'-nucleotidase C-terminal domain-containing protein n=1 Tax=Nonomuraea sp. NPDC050328 TaxID=3364361 RepID=UPI0037AF9CAE
MTAARRRAGSVAAILAFAAGLLAVPAQAAPTPVVFGTAAASPKTQAGTCPATVRLAVSAKVKAPATLKYVWTFSDGDTSAVKTYRVGGKGVKKIRLATTLKVHGDVRGWGAVRLLGPAKKTSAKAAFSVDCPEGSGGSGGGADTWEPVGYTVEGATKPVTPPPAGQGQERSLTLSKSTANPGDKVTVTVTNTAADVRTITSAAFTPAVHPVSGQKRAYSFQATVAEAPGEHEVRAVFADNSFATATLKVVALEGPVKKATIDVERVTAAKCPVTFKIRGTFEGLPAGAQTVRYRYVGTEAWQSVEVPAGHKGAHTAVLEPLELTAETSKGFVQVEIDQPGRLKSNIVYYLKCHGFQGGQVIGTATADIALTPTGGPVVELVADALLESIKSVSGAQIALVSRRSVEAGLKAGPLTIEDAHGTQPRGNSLQALNLTGAQLKKLLGEATAQTGPLTPSAGVRYTLTGSTVTELTINGVAVTDAQVIRVAATHILMSGYDGFPTFREGTDRFTGGLDDGGAVATYIARNTPVQPPKGDRVTLVP